MEEFKIMCFTWNANGLRLCETLVQSKADTKRKGFSILNRAKCLVPDFFSNVLNEIRSQNPKLVVISTEDENDKDTYFHSELMPLHMSENNYSLIKRDVLNNVGDQNYINVPTGKPTGSALRISIYALNTIITELQVAERPKVYTQKESQKGLICKPRDSSIASGAIASYIWHPKFGTFAFVAVKLATSQEFEKSGLPYENYRAMIHHANIGCLMNIVTQLIENPQPKELKPDHIFLMGDFNSNIVDTARSNQKLIEDITKTPTTENFKNFLPFDELTKSMKTYPLVNYAEGVSANNGPLFLPTWKLFRGRTSDRCEIKSGTPVPTSCFSTTGGIGWHDRILNKDKPDSTYFINCVQYNRFDVGNMHQSTQAGVVGVYELKERR